MVHAYQPCGNTRCFQNQRFSNRFVLVLILVLVFSPVVYCQVETATISGVITDQSGAVVAGAEVRVTNTDTNGTWMGVSNGSGVYLVTGLKPGSYRVHVAKDGFKTIDLTDMVLNVQDSVSRNLTLQVGSTSESVSVEGDALQINLQDASVSTIVDRQFAENLPLNGRSFQTLIQLTPGVVLTTSSLSDSGQFSVNGQRASSNYWMVDGVSANIGIGVGVGPGNGLGGGLGSFSVFGGTNSLVSVDALQEFRIQTSTYAPEFGRTPGGQISIVTRSGTNQFHGTAFDYFRNDVLDANDWFGDSAGLPKPKERQNDFGGTFSGPILKDRTFFFFSYEGLRLRLPQVTLGSVPDTSNTPGGLNSRQNAIAAAQPFFNAYPLPNGPEVFAPCDPSTDPACPPTGQKATGTAQFNASYSNPSTLDAYSLRVDHKLSQKITLFGRYNYSPSEIIQRGNGDALSAVFPSRITTQTGTVGAAWVISPATSDDVRFNYSRTASDFFTYLDGFGGAIPPTSFPFPSPFTARNAAFVFSILSLAQGPSISVDSDVQNRQRQINFVNNVSMQKGRHSLKFGVDYRHLSPIRNPNQYAQNVSFFDIPSAQSGNVFRSGVQSLRGETLFFNNLGLFAQDTWRLSPRITATYGLRWDVDFAPSSSNGPNLPAITGYNLNDLSQLALAPPGTPPFKTSYGNVAPRLGVAYELSQHPDWVTVLRGGVGMFFDLATQEVGNLLTQGYPTVSRVFSRRGSFPLDASTAAPPPIIPPDATQGILAGFDPNLELPYTLEWNVALEQALGREQSVSVSYVGAAGRRLIQTAEISGPNPNLATALLTGNTASSSYNALQAQFQRRLSHGLQALASYTWSHSIDSASAGSIGNTSNGPASGNNPNVNRGSSDFDIRNTFSAGVTYDLPAPRTHSFAKVILRGWSTENVIQARSAPPVDVFNSAFGNLLNGFNVNVRPDVISGIPLYLYGSQYPGGKVINNTLGAVAGGCSDGSASIGPFCPPPIDPTTGSPTRQGNLSRNALRGFGATQWDFAVHRDFPIRESLKLQFRAEMFNVLNHPNFGQPIGDLINPQFGQSIQMLGRSLNGALGGTLGGGAFSPLYQIGGPRSIQFALKLFF